MSAMRFFWADRIGWQKYIQPFMEKRLPAHTDWTATLGSVSVLLFVIQIVTGILLALYYTPSPEHAYTSIHYIMDEVSMGQVLRGIHHWGASIMLVLVFLHMTINFFQGTFKAPRELTWIAGVVLFLLTVGFGFTGYLLPWDQKAYWATTVGVNLVKEIPFFGEILGRLVLGGEEVSGFTLTRFYALHMLVLPALMALFIAFHIYLVRLHDLAGPPVEKKQENSEYRFYPEHLFRSSIVFAFVFAVILAFTFWGHIPLENQAGTVDPDYVPRPEWYFMGLFELLTFFPGKLEFIGSFLIPFLGIIVLVLLPFLSWNNLRRAVDRPFGLAVGVTTLVAVVYLTAMGIAKSQPYGNEYVLPSRELTQTQVLGLDVYMEKDCAYCHTVLGEGGRREGPDLSNVVRKDRTEEWLIEFIRNPQEISRWSIMPQYQLSDNELKALADFLLVLDFSKYEAKLFSKQEAQEIVHKKLKKESP